MDYIIVNLIRTKDPSFAYFAKVLIYHDLRYQSNAEIASRLKTNPFFIKDYKLAASNFTKQKLVQIIALLREYDVKSKGIGNVSASASELLKELTFKILR